MANTVKIPTWMDRHFFTTVVRHHSADANAEVSDFTVKESLTPGENFVSVIFRAKISYSTAAQNATLLSVVIKIPPTTGIQADFCETSPLYVTEQDMYSDPLHEIKKLLKSIGDFSKLQPNLIYQATTPRRVLVMEDLGAEGYERITQPLPKYEDSRRVFERLAKFHAAGFFLINEKKGDLSRFKESIFHLESPMIRETFLNEPFDVLCEVLTSWGGFDDYVTRLQKFRQNYIEKGKQLYEPDSNGYNVLNHGDFHIKNLLFKTTGDEIEDFYFLDYQVSVLASPCVDLFYALYNMISNENRRTRRDQIIYEYHTEFSKTLQRLRYVGRIPTLLDLQIDLLKHGFMEVVKCVCFQIFFVLETVQLGEFFNCGDSKKFKAQLFNEPRFRSFIEVELPRLVHLGFL